MMSCRLALSLACPDVFHEGNKRTAALLVKTYAAYEGYGTHDDKLLRIITEMIRKNTSDTSKIEEMIKDAIA